MSTVRRVIPLVLMGGGLAAVVLAAVADSATSRAIWIGVASTLITAGLVDGTATLEASRRERVLLRVAYARARRARYSLLQVIRTTFELKDGTLSGPSQEELVRRLRCFNRSSLDLTGEASGVSPPRSKETWIAENLQELDDAPSAALATGLQTAQADHFERLDRVVRRSSFYVVARAGALKRLGGGAELLASEAADLLDELAGFGLGVT